MIRIYPNNGILIIRYRILAEESADIRLVDVWKQYNGNPAIIVAVVDGGH